MNNHDTEGAIAYALDRLVAELPSHYTYHNLAHTAEGVLPAVVRLAAASGVDRADGDLLRVAAAFHDLGFLHRVVGHEITSARMAAQVLPGFGFDRRSIDIIMGTILATRLPQSPRTPLEEILADADLDSLGRADFFDRNIDLRQEMAFLDQPPDLADWYASQIEFLQSHHYFTPAARQANEVGKQENLQHMQKLLAALTR